MSLMTILLKILLFFIIFYASIGITTFLAKKIREKQKINRDAKSKKEN